MIIKIFNPAPGFAAVRYNTNKVEKNKGELLKVANFGALQGLGLLRPQDYVNYLKMVSARNRNTKLPQFHAMISAKNRSFDKTALVEMAEAWLKEMGYGGQPYLLVFHKDTANNHLHMVSTRIDKYGKKIDSGFEHLRSITAINKIIGLDENLKARQDMEKALAYTFSTKAQFMMILEGWGYRLEEKSGELQLIKYGKRLAGMHLKHLKEKMSLYAPDLKRAKQLTAIFHEYRKHYSSELRTKTTPLPGGLQKNMGQQTSDLAEFLRKKFGLQLVFHRKEEKAVYGYTIIDHAEQQVYKGGQVMDLNLLLETVQVQPERLSSLKERSDVAEINSPGSAQPFETEDTEISQETRPAAVQIAIADDIDDEAVLGRNRRRKKKARTNTR